MWSPGDLNTVDVLLCISPMLIIQITVLFMERKKRAY